MAFVGCIGIDLCTDAHHARNASCLGLCAAHASQPCSDKEFHVISLARKLPSGIHQGDGCAMDNALRTDVHETACGHLTILRYA